MSGQEAFPPHKVQIEEQTRIYRLRSVFFGSNFFEVSLAISDRPPDLGLDIVLPLSDERSTLFLLGSFLNRCGRESSFAVKNQPGRGSRLISQASEISSSIRANWSRILLNLEEASKEVLSLASAIYDLWPSRVVHLRPESQDHRASEFSLEDRQLLGIAEDLARIAPLMVGTFPPALGGFNFGFITESLSFPLDRLNEVHYIDESNLTIVEGLRAIIMALLDHRFPTWTFILFESYFPSLVQDIVRYIPHLGHLRVAPWYGSQYRPLHGPQIDRDRPEYPHLSDILFSKIESIINDLDCFMHARSLGWEERFESTRIWHLETPGQTSSTSFRSRSGLDISGSIADYVQRIGWDYDDQDPPSSRLVQVLIDQFLDHPTGAFASDWRGLLAPMIIFCTDDQEGSSLAQI